VVDACPRRIVEREFVPQPPGEHTHTQAGQSYGEGAQSWTLFTQWGGLWDRHLALLTMMPH
jgi:hypothetical protein